MITENFWMEIYMIKIQKNVLLLLLICHFTHDNIAEMFILRMTIITVTKHQVAFDLTLCDAEL